MRIQKLERDRLSEAYGILCQGVFPWSGVAQTPFYATWCVVEPGGVARAHKHQEHESFLIVKGRGLMRVDDDTAEVEPGDVVFMDPFQEHELTNLSDGEELLFLDLCWEQMEEALEVNRRALDAAGARRPQTVVVTATPPTPNGDLHVGHLSGPYLAADVYSRYLRQRGSRALYLSGADDHQSYVPAKAARLGVGARQLADDNGEAMQETLRRAGIELTHWARPAVSPHHTAMVQEVFAELWQRGAIVARKAPTLFDADTGRCLFEAHVVGGCPHCGERSNGNACEACGRPNDCVDLIDPRPVHGTGEVVVREIERLYFPLAPYAEALRGWWDRTPMSPHLRSLCDRMLADGLPDIAVSHPADWGVPVPVAGFEEQRIYVWFEMGPGYFAATQEALDAAGDDVGWRSLWTSPERQVVQFFGFDNGYFHALLFPATFLAYDPEIRLPSAFVVNEFYRYEGAKFSTSRNHAMWGKELLDRVPADVARFYLAWDNPEREQTNFTFAALEDTVRRELVEGWQPWLRGLGVKVAELFAGTVPGTGGWTDDHQRFFRTLERITGEAAAACEAAGFSPQRLARLLSELVREARRFGQAEGHWAGLPERFEQLRTAVALEVLAAKTVAQLAAPLMPGFAERLWHDLGFTGSPAAAGWPEVPEMVPGGQRISGLDRAYFEQPAARPLATA